MMIDDRQKIKISGMFNGMKYNKFKISSQQMVPYVVVSPGNN